MVAIVTSTINPFVEGIVPVKSFYTFPERLEHTKETLKSLQQNGFENIFLVDNSITLNQSQLSDLLIDFPAVKIHHIDQYQFANKGINELLMLLFICKDLPPGQPIFKISGRYKINSSFRKPTFSTIAVKGYNFNSKTGTISTRAYWVQDSSIFEDFLLKCLNEVFAYAERVVGARSLYRKLKNLFTNQVARQLNISIEFAAANVLKQGAHNITLMDNLGIEGLVAGSNHIEKITE